MQADAFAGFNDLYDAKRQPAPIVEAACWSHGRRKFFDLAKLAKSLIALEAVRRIDGLFEIERTVNGKLPDKRVAVRRELSKPLVAGLEAWLHTLIPLTRVRALSNLRCAWRKAGEKIMPGPVCERIKALVDKRPGLTATEIAEELFGKGGYQQQVNQACRWLLKQGRIVRGSKGGQSDPYRYHKA